MPDGGCPSRKRKCPFFNFSLEKYYEQLKSVAEFYKTEKPESDKNFNISSCFISEYVFNKLS